jgi:uncharacterized membrane protein YqgA involved in biofilm formation
MKGTLLNTATVAVGSFVGYEAGRFIPPSYGEVAITGLGLVVSMIGVRMFFQSKNPVISIAAIAVGGVVGELIGIAPGLTHFAEFVRSQVGGGKSFNEGLIATSVIFCVGPMTLLGCLQDALEGNIELLALKSTLDGISSIFFAATLGAGVLASALVVLIVQGSITLAARPLRRFVQDEELIAEATAVGGALMLGIGLSVLDIKKIHTETYLPALVFAPLFCAVARRWTRKQKAPA